VRAIVLDGAPDPDLTATEFRLSQYGGLQKAFDGLAASCAAAADCPLGTVEQFRKRMGERAPIWTRIGVSAFGAPTMRVEIRVTAIIGHDG
jgi:hypothetical protein